MSRDNACLTLISGTSIEYFGNIGQRINPEVDQQQMDLSTTTRRPPDATGNPSTGNVGEHIGGQKSGNHHRVAKSVFSIRSLVDVEDADLPNDEGNHSGYGEFIFLSLG